MWNENIWSSWDPWVEQMICKCLQAFTKHFVQPNGIWKGPANDIIVLYYDNYFAEYYIRNKYVVSSNKNTSNYFAISN